MIGRIVKRTFLALLYGGLAACAGYVLFVVWHAPPCNRSDQVETATDAIEFGKYWLRRDDELPGQLGLATLAPVDAELAKPECCTARRLDPETNGGRDWQVTIDAAQEPGAAQERPFGLHFVVSFSACRKAIVEERQTRMYPLQANDPNRP